jgi:hypothetical protein
MKTYSLVPKPKMLALGYSTGDIAHGSFVAVSNEPSYIKKVVLAYFSISTIVSYIIFNSLPESTQNKWVSRGPVPLNLFIGVATGFQLFIGCPIIYGVIVGYCTSSVIIGIVTVIATIILHFYLSGIIKSE